MKTLIIYNQTADGLSYCIVDGDYSKLDGIVITDVNETKKRVDMALDFLYDENYNDKHVFSEDISLIANKQWDKVALITFVN